MDIIDLLKRKGFPEIEYTSIEILEIRGARIFIGVTALTSAIGLIFQFLAGHGLRILIPTVLLYTLAIFFAYRLYRRRKRRAEITFYALAVALIMFLIPIVARYNYGINIDWLYAAQCNHVNWLLMANLIVFQFLYRKRLYLLMIYFVILNIIVFYIIAWHNGVPMPFHTYTDGKVNHGIMSSREIYTVLMFCVVAYLSYRNIPEIEEFDELARKQADVIKEQVEEEIRKTEEIQSQYEELEAQYEEIEQMNVEMTSAQSEIMEVNNSLKQQKEKLAATIKSIVQGIIEVDTGMHIKLFNDGAVSILGISGEKAMGSRLDEILNISITGGKSADFYSSEFLNGNMYYDLYNSVLMQTSEGLKELTLRSAPLRIEGGDVYGYVIIIDDVTELKKMKEHIINSSKLESLGIFAGGIAHDINNFFTGMLGCVALAKKNLSGSDINVLKYLEDAESTAIKARGLAEQLLTFSKGGEPVKKIIQVRDILTLAADFVLSGTRITCRKEFAPDLKMIEADETQFSQVISNILINALQAMPGGGEIKIIACNAVLANGNVYALPAGEYVEISIEDQGPGIDDGLLNRVFDPFFTTKSDGSGLGLSVAYSVLKKHGGTIRAFNGRTGAVFRILVPSAEAGDLPAENICIEETCFSGKVLIMDDDYMIRMVGVELLESLGFVVLSAGDGDEAVKIFREEYESGAGFEFVILDLTIKGGAGGLETLRELQKIDPLIRGIVSSGYSQDPVMSDYREHGFAAVLKKPYNFSELKAVISKVSGL